MKIAIYSTQIYPSSPNLDTYAGLELISGLQAKYFDEQGHDVSLFACEGSFFSEEDHQQKLCSDRSHLYTVGPKGTNPVVAWKTYWDMPETRKILMDAEIICDHSWNYYPYSVYHNLKNVCHTWHGPYPDFKTKPPFDKMNLIGISFSHSKLLNKLSGMSWRTVYNGIPIYKYTFNNKPIAERERLLWLSRIYYPKGAHRAIEIANSLKMPIDIVGGSFGDVPAYTSLIKDMCEKSTYATFHGEVNFAKKLELYRNAKCVILPIIERIPAETAQQYMGFNQAFEWYEPFGLVTCLPPESKIITNDKIKEIQYIREGDKVLTHKNRFKKVLKTTKRKINGELIEITPYGNETIRLTPEHEILTLGDIIKTDNIFGCTRKIGWKKAKEIKKGEVVFFPKVKRNSYKRQWDLSEFDKIESNEKSVWYKFAAHLKINRIIKLNEELCELLGWYIAEGSVHYVESGYSAVIEFSLGSHEKKHIKRIIYLINKIFGIKATYKEIETRARIMVSSKIIGTFFDFLCGKGAKNKRIPNEILFHKNKKLLNALVASATCGDGYIDRNHKHKQVSYATISLQLAYQMKIALIRLDKRPMISIRKDNVGFASNNDLYLISYTEYDSIKKEHNNKAYWINRGYLAYYIKSVNKLRYNGDVYNLIVDEDKTYTTSSFIVHNCEAGSCGTPTVVVPNGGWTETMIHGYNGFFANSNEEFEYYIKRINEIRPEDCRAQAEKFDYKIMGENYLKIFDEIISGNGW